MRPVGRVIIIQNNIIKNNINKFIIIRLLRVKNIIKNGHSVLFHLLVIEKIKMAQS